jgi:hypothetical protein
VQPPDLYDLHAEGLEPGEQSVQGGFILNGAVNDRLDRLDRGGEPVEIEQGLGREDARYPDFVVRRWHRRPLPTRNQTAKLYRYASRPGSPHPWRMSSGALSKEGEAELQEALHGGGAS